MAQHEVLRFLDEVAGRALMEFGHIPYLHLVNFFSIPRMFGFGVKAHLPQGQPDDYQWHIAELKAETKDACLRVESGRALSSR